MKKREWKARAEMLERKLARWQDKVFEMIGASEEILAREKLSAELEAAGKILESEDWI